MDKHYASSFVGYFPADNPKYSCIVVVHKPNTAKNNYYGADVAGPVFKRIAQKIFTDTPSTNVIKKLDRPNPKQESNYNTYFVKMQKKQNVCSKCKRNVRNGCSCFIGEFGFERLKLLELGK